MALFLLIDPVDERRAVIKVLLGSHHRVAECRSFEESLVACQGQTFKAAFVAYPEAARNRHSPVSTPTWSAERLVLVLSDRQEVKPAADWGKAISYVDPITLSGPLSTNAVAGVLNAILGSASMKLPELLGRSAAMQLLLKAAARVAGNDLPVLIFGEPGTGKETLARWLHACGSRSQAAFERRDVKPLDSRATT